MKKALTLIALACLLLGCKKFGTHSDGPLTISFPQSSYEIEAGKSIDFTISRTPSSGKEPKYVFSSTSPEVASVNGSKIVAKSEGTTTIRATVKDDEKVFCECTVNVIPYVNAKEITSIATSKSKVEVSDLGFDGGADFVNVAVNLLPADAGWEDVSVYSDDEDVQVDKIDGDPLNLKISVTPNPGHEETDVREVAVHLDALKGGVKRTLTVKVCGHISSMRVPILQTKDFFPLVDGIIRYARSFNYRLTAEYSITGTLKSTLAEAPVSYESSSDFLDVDHQSGHLSIPAGKGVTAGSGDPFKITVRTPYSPEIVPYVEVPVHTYEMPASLNFDIHQDTNHLLTGRSYRLSITSNPEKSLCYLNLYTYPVEILENLTFTNLASSIMVDFKVAKSAGPQKNIVFSNPLLSHEQSSWDFYADDYSESEPKTGDFVYYNNGSFDWSDGGLRANSDTGVRYAEGATKRPVSGKGTLIGVIYDDYEPVSSVTDIIRLAGLSGKHFKVCCVKDATVGDGESGSGKYSYTKSSCSIPDRWSNSYPKPTAYEENTIGANLGIVAYNNGINDSDYQYRIRAHYPVESLGDSNKTGSLPVKVGTSSTTGSSGWLMPLKKDAEKLIERKAIITHSSSINSLSGTYWTASYDTSDKAWSFTSSGVSSVNRASVLTTRAILIL